MISLLDFLIMRNGDSFESTAHRISTHNDISNPGQGILEQQFSTRLIRHK